LSSGQPRFSAHTFAFLEALAANNNRGWFQEHKREYERQVREPALAFIEAAVPGLAVIAPHFRADSRKMGGSLMRIYRDTRFSRDKSPYKTNIGIQFRHEAGRDVHAPGYYLHISAADCFVGVGIWQPPADALAMIRRAIDERPDEWLAARDDAAFRRWFSLSGDSLKRPPRGFALDHPLIDDLKRKDFIAMAELAPPLIEQEDFASIACDYFATATPLMRFLCRALQLPF